MLEEAKLIKNNFEQLLGWLDKDRDAAGQKYELIRRRLIKIFEARGCFPAEELADETINRVTGKIYEIVESFQGEPAVYFLAVARNVRREFFRQPQPVKLSENIINELDYTHNELKSYYDCLNRCLEKLNPERQKFILDYYAPQKGTSIEARRAVAEKFNLTHNAANARAFRLRKSLEKCVIRCVKKKSEIF
jgi:DNA-directed RNA polymerase specialized sigma24 family protein